MGVCVCVCVCDCVCVCVYVHLLNFSNKEKFRWSIAGLSSLFPFSNIGN